MLETYVVKGGWFKANGGVPAGWWENGGCGKEILNSSQKPLLALSLIGRFFEIGIRH